MHPSELNGAKSAFKPEWSVSAEQVGDDHTLWDVTMSVYVGIEADIEDKPIVHQFSTTIVQRLKVEGFPLETLNKNLAIARASDLFAKAREVISKLSVDSPFGSLLLPPIPFDALIKDV